MQGMGTVAGPANVRLSTGELLPRGLSGSTGRATAQVRTSPPAGRSTGKGDREDAWASVQEDLHACAVTGTGQTFAWVQ